MKKCVCCKKYTKDYVRTPWNKGEKKFPMCWKCAKIKYFQVKMLEAMHN